MTVVALTPLLVGGREVAVGEEVPESVTAYGRVRPVDVDRLVADGLAERKTSPKSSSSRKGSSKAAAGAE